MINNKGFTLIELLIAMAILGLILASLGLPVYLNHVETAKENICESNRRVIEHAEDQYFFDKGTHSNSFQDLVSSGYLKEIVGCPSDGVYAWINDDEDLRTLVCSKHGLDLPEPKTPLGTDLSEIREGFIDLLSEYKELNGEYPKGSGKKIINDLGLDFEDWKNGIDGIKYRPSGDVLKLTSDKGYEFIIIDSKGKTLNPGTVVYSMETGQWYYDKVKEGREIDINELIVTEKQ